MSNGVRIEKQTIDSIDSSKQTFRPTKDRIIVKPLHWDESTKIHSIRKGSPVRGEVIAVGPGTYRKRYSENRTKVTETNVFIPMEVKPGDIVNWGGLNIFDGDGYAFPEVNIDNERHLIIQQGDICAIESN